MLPLAALAQGCVTVDVPLAPDSAYPRDWGAIASLGPQCKAIEGRYRNEGTLYTPSGEVRPLKLLTLLEVPGSASAVRLSVTTRRVDANGDAAVTLSIVPDDDAAAAQRREDCICRSQTLACVRVGEQYWKVPNFGAGGPQANVYLSLTQEGALVAKRVSYQVSAPLGTPVFDVTRAWVRFERPASR